MSRTIEVVAAPQTSVVVQGERPDDHRLTTAVAIGWAVTSLYALDAWVLQPDAGTSIETRAVRFLLICGATLAMSFAWRLAGRTGRAVMAAIFGVGTIVVTAGIPLMSVVKGRTGPIELLGLLAFVAGITMATSGIAAWSWCSFATGAAPDSVSCGWRPSCS